MAATQIRFLILALGVIISFHYILTFTNETYGNATSLARLKEQFAGSTPKGGAMDAVSAAPRKANAAFVILARNGDLNGIVTSVKQMEDRFNKKFNYPYVFLNDEPFNDAFKKRITALTDSDVKFGLIPRSVPYRNMCRFNSGFFYRHELLKQYKYYWRVEPDIKYFCDLDYDPFLVMQDEGKVYGFTVSLFEYPATIPTLWQTTKGYSAEFINSNPKLVSPENAMAFLSDDGGETYNRCHFWSNFEIGDLDLWRGEAYSKFFDFLDERGGFYYERWGDAPVHSIGAALFARKDQIHFFEDIGYRHEPFQHCPQGTPMLKGSAGVILRKTLASYREWYSCLNKYEALFTNKTRT
ncbi:unnamed protein product [Mycena citricolor]|uniref:Glycosyltransferase family 15 protein n=1 Tax=Mycena citricolor TaxID=2018698 RepID=A0AAD2HKM0_9AGAR|nr:unnamed protein product [Mycena citricolor]